MVSLQQGTQAISVTLRLQRCAVGVALSTLAVTGTLMPATLAAAQSVTAESPAAIAEPIAPTATISNAADAVARFDPATHLYIQGEPLTSAQVTTLQTLLQQNPNVYVVLIERTDDVMRDDMTLSRGIGNSAAFQSVVNDVTGEREGVLLMVYFDSNEGRKIFMRAEALPDRLGVGEANFADPAGNPRELLRLFVTAIQTEGKDVPGALEVVIQRINGTIQSAVQETAQGAEQTVQQAEARLASFQASITAFQSEYSVGGQVGNPPIAPWQAQIASAKAALETRQFAEAQTLAETVQGEIEAAEQGLNNYRQAGAIAQTADQELAAIERSLNTLKDNTHTQAVSQLSTQARDLLEQYQAQYQTGDPGFWESLQSAQAQIEQAQAEIKASRALTTRWQYLRGLFIALGILAVGLPSIVAYRRTLRRRQRAEQELAEARAEIDGKAQALIALMNKADYAALANYTGKTDRMAQDLMARVTDALTLIGGAEKFMAEAETLIRARSPLSQFRTANADRAIALLCDAKTQLSFGPEDSARAVMTQGSSAESWQQRVLAQGSSRRFAKSFQDVMLAMAENRDAATALLEEITTKEQGISQYLAQIETDATALTSRTQALQNADRPFRLEAATQALLPLVLGPVEQGGLVARGRAVMVQDPVSAWDEFGDPAQQKTQAAAAIVAIAENARMTLMPTLDQARQALAPHQVQTDWAIEQQQALSDELEAIARSAMAHPITDPLYTLEQRIHELASRIKQIVRQDQARRETCLNLIATATQSVAYARQEIYNRLQQSGAFSQGTVQQVLRETERDPTERIQAAQSHLDQVKPCLDQGDSAAAETHLTQVRTLTRSAHDLIEATRSALESYDATLQERQQRTEAIHTSIASTYQPILDQLVRHYVPEALEQVAAEVASGSTVANNIGLAHNLLEKTRTLLREAQVSYSQANLLASRDQLGDADRLLKGSAYQLEAITLAQTTLSQHQQQTKADAVALHESLTQLEASAQLKYVRQPSQKKVEQAIQAGTQAQARVQSRPYHPYLAQQLLTMATERCAEATQAIAADQEAYAAAWRAAARLEQSVDAVNLSIEEARRLHLAHASVSTTAAVRALAEAERMQQQVHALLTAQSYEAGEDLADQAEVAAQEALRIIRLEVRQAERRNDVERSRRARIAQRRSSASSYNSFSGGSSGSSGGGFGGGSSGSSGGGFGGGGSGSSGGGW